MAGVRYMTRLVIGLVVLALFIYATQAGAHHRLAKKYDRAFQRAQHRYAAMPIKHDWKLLKAQCATESALRPEAVSPAGAMGLCQFIPTTWKEWGDSGASPFNARASIKASARYMRWQWGHWSLRRRPPTCQYELALAAYNAGLGNILRAQLAADDALCWNAIQGALSGVTGHHAEETRNYITRNRNAYRGAGGTDLW